MSQLDPRFLQARRQASLRHRRRRGWRVAGALAGSGILAGLAAGWLLLEHGPRGTDQPRPPPDQAGMPGPDLSNADTLPAETQGAALPAPPLTAQDMDDASFPRGSIDLPGDPLLLQLGGGGGVASARLPRPDILPPDRGQGEILVIQAPLLAAGERLAVTLPSSQDDFAIFQAQRQRMMQRPTAPADARTLPASTRTPRSVAEARALVEHGAGGGPGSERGADALPLIPTHARQRPFMDSFLRLSRDSGLASLLENEGLSSDEARHVAQAAAEALGRDHLQAGQILALRQMRQASGVTEFAQLAIYDGDRYLGALGRGDALPRQGGPDPQPPPAGPEIGTAADPWLRQDLPALLAGTAQAGAQGTASPRVMDALYAAALRHGLPPGLVGQVIMLLAQTYKLDSDATPEDRLTLLYSAMPGGGDGSTQASDLDQLIYVALDGDSGTRLRCYIHRPDPARAPACYGPAAAGQASAPPRSETQALTGGGAVEQLVNRIIQIESAGRADARNPLSTATGLGQFIESTWLRMMRTYRPDLTATLSRSELLALRTDPDISREMVLNLSREGESYLRARGHEITAGRLYLAHFLGMEGAHTALSAAPHEDLLTLFGAGVINANPFLRGRDAGYVVEWAEAKMRGASGRIAVIREPEGLAAFRTLVDRLLAEL
ncbi:hypothetical protein [Roseinatronobacter alkalisoli]|uniref:Transglycosylase SLT domain-containing protein n=1 Tax=Roseinatronobacter alkalisoli TaxID=3028235 RepID=A0ABT5TD22_9RHOB|nr:hypothetical protein [Roseinatronobacter sp. HJB301]MDD7972874.1 hypothetical protein [Roseinatronobacter sp. HJB301]